MSDRAHVRATTIEPLKALSGIAVPFDHRSVDTDTIFPVSADAQARKEGFGTALFARWRTDSDFVLNQPIYAGASILLTDSDFGIGSSRETAVWALTGAGFRAVIAPSFGDIFRANCARNRLIAATIDEAARAAAHADLINNPGASAEIDVVEQTFITPGGTYPVEIPSFVRRLLVDGLDELDLLLSRRARIDDLLAGRTSLTQPTTDLIDGSLRQ